MTVLTQQRHPRTVDGETGVAPPHIVVDSTTGSLQPSHPIRVDPGYYDEMFETSGKPREASINLVKQLSAIDTHSLLELQRAAEQSLLNLGITFTVYDNDAGTERIWPFDLLPRIVAASEWRRIERGLQQRIRALNLFIDDVYNDRNIVGDGIVPGELIESASALRQQLMGFRPPAGIWNHISGVDLVRDADGTMYVLEDNLSDAAFADKMQRFVAASMQGWKWAEENPEDAAMIVLDFDETGAQTETHQIRMMGEVAKLTAGSNGALDPADYERTVATLLAGGSDPVITAAPEGAWTPAITDAALN